MVDPEDRQLPLFDSRDVDIRQEGKSILVEPGEESQFSKYVVYVDESGDHSLQTIDENYPLFVLAFCVFHKRHYSEVVVPALEKFKFNHFGHDQVVLHENEIRKEKGAFNIFHSQEQREKFLDELNGIIDASNFILISCTIDKRLVTKVHANENPYHIALNLCLETLYEFLEEKGQEAKQTHVIVECRGRKEDAELELEFRRVCDRSAFPFEVIFSDKKVMSSGLQLADLVARPIGLRTLRPDQDNRAFEVLKRKFYCEGGRVNAGTGYEGYGMKIFPSPESEKPR